jgi:SAM-dependent methyltransferase
MFYGADQAAIHHERFGALAAMAAEDLLAELRAADLTAGTVVDLGCGSGILAELLVRRGFEVLGVDVSQEMLAIASRRAPGARFVRGSLWEVDLPPCVAVVAVGETLGYAAPTTAGAPPLDALLARAHRALEPGGVLLFDVTTAGRAGVDGTREAFHDRDEWSLFLRATTLHAGQPGATEVRRIVLFRRNGDAYRRTDEEHVVRLFDPASVESAMHGAGFSPERLGGYHDLPFGPGVAGFAATR